MKKILRFALLIIVLNVVILFSGCGEKETKAVVPNKAIAQDIKSSKTIQNCFTSDYVYDSTYKYISHEIIQRETNIEDEEEIIYCNAIVQSDYFKLEIEIVLNYELDGVEDWCLENLKILRKKSVAPIKCAEKELIISKLFGENSENILCIEYNANEDVSSSTLRDEIIEKIGMTDTSLNHLYRDSAFFEFGEVELNKNNETTLLSITYKYGHFVTAEGYIRLFFDDKKGWTFLDDVQQQGDNTMGGTPIVEANNVELNYNLNNMRTTFVSDMLDIVYIDTKKAEVGIVGYDFDAYWETNEFVVKQRSTYDINLYTTEIYAKTAVESDEKYNREMQWRYDLEGEWWTSLKLGEIIDQ